MKAVNDLFHSLKQDNSTPSVLSSTGSDHPSGHHRELTGQSSDMGLSGNLVAHQAQCYMPRAEVCLVWNPTAVPPALMEGTRMLWGAGPDLCASDMPECLKDVTNSHYREHQDSLRPHPKTLPPSVFSCLRT